jgi:hypothetical protein
VLVFFFSFSFFSFFFLLYHLCVYVPIMSRPNSRFNMYLILCLDISVIVRDKVYYRKFRIDSETSAIKYFTSLCEYVTFSENQNMVELNECSCSGMLKIILHFLLVEFTAGRLNFFTNIISMIRYIFTKHYILYVKFHHRCGIYDKIFIYLALYITG